MKDETIQIVLHPALREPLETWLAERNCQLVRIPIDEEHDLPTYIVSPHSLETIRHA